MNLGTMWAQIGLDNSQLKTGVESSKKELQSIVPVTNGVADSMKGMVIGAASLFSIYQFGAAIKTMVGGSISYLAQLETSQLAIAASFMLNGDYINNTTGAILKGVPALHAAQADSADMMKQLQAINLQTIATLDELVIAYQQALPIAMAKGFNRDQVVQFTAAMVQAAGAIGLPFNQMGEEIRSLLTGAINPRNSRIATVLGLRNEDIAKMEGDAQKLFTFLMNKLEPFRIAGVESQKTWAGLFSNTKDIALNAGGQAMTPVFESVKYELMEITNQIVSVDEKTKAITWSPAFLEGVSTVRTIITDVIAEMYRFSMLLDKMGGTMTATFSHLLQVVGVATKVMTLGNFGQGALDASAKMKDYNKMYEERYNASDKALQKLADREIQRENKTSDSVYKQKVVKTREAFEAEQKLLQAQATSRQGMNVQALGLLKAQNDAEQMILAKRYIGEDEQARQHFKDLANLELSEKDKQIGNARQNAASLGGLAGIEKQMNGPKSPEYVKASGDVSKANMEIKTLLQERANILIKSSYAYDDYIFKMSESRQKEVQGFVSDYEKLNAELLQMNGSFDSQMANIQNLYKDQLSKALEFQGRAKPEDQTVADDMVKVIAEMIQKKTEFAEIEWDTGIKSTTAQYLEMIGQMERAAQIKAETQKSTPAYRALEETALGSDSGKAAQAEDALKYLDLIDSINISKGKQTEIDKQLSIALAEHQNQISILDGLESTYAMTTTEATTKRINLLNLEKSAYEARLQTITGSTPDEVQAFQSVQASLTGVNRTIQEQQQLLNDRSAWVGFIDGFKQYARESERVGAELQSAVVGAFKSMTDAITEFVMTGKFSFKDLADSIIKDMIRIVIQQQITGPLAAAAGNFLSSLGSSSSSTGQTYTSSGGYNNAVSPSSYVLGSYASGTDYVPKTGPYMLHEGESVGTASDNKKATAVDLKVEIINQTGTQAKAKEGSSYFDGKQMVKTIILEAMDTDPTFKNAVRG